MTSRRQFLIAGAGACAACASGPERRLDSAAGATPKPARTFTLAIQGFMDPTTEQAVRQVWQELADAQISDTHLHVRARPHMTLASWTVSAVTDAIKADLAKAAATLAPQPILLHLEKAQHGEDAGLFLVPGVDDPIFSFHKNLHHLVASPGAPYRPQDLPGQWRAHLSLAYGFPADRLQEAHEICKRLPGRVEARIEHVALVTFGPIDYPAVFPLTGTG